jgi:hypothetical protein
VAAEVQALVVLSQLPHRPMTDLPHAA